jgi:uncharacterized membrane protein YfcA
MENPKDLLFVALGVIGVLYLAGWVRDLRRRRAEGGATGFPSTLELLIGFLTNFFDTLGIGSYAPTTASFRFWKLVDDKRIPGTMNVGHALPTITEASIFIAIIAVGFKTLVLLIAAAMLGAWLGAGVVARMSRRNIQLGMGGALLVAATLFVMADRGIVTAGGDATSLEGVKLGLGIVGSIFLGALMTLGIGFYAPCLIMISLLGMNPTAGFPIMMGACAFLMPVASMRFFKERAYEPRPALGLALGGIPGVLIAALIVKSLPLLWVRRLVIVVVLYAAIGLLRAAFAKKAATQPT